MLGSESNHQEPEKALPLRCTEENTWGWEEKAERGGVKSTPKSTKSANCTTVTTLQFVHNHYLMHHVKLFT